MEAFSVLLSALEDIVPMLHHVQYGFMLSIHLEEDAAFQHTEQNSINCPVQAAAVSIQSGTQAK
jgi:hypothetical protein